MGHEDRQIADNLHAELVRVTLQRKPLPEKEKLVKPVGFDLFAQLFARVFECGRRATDERRFPLVPCDTTMRILECTEEGVIVEPVGLLLCEGFESAAQRGIGRFCVAIVCPAQQLVFAFVWRRRV